MPMTEDGVGKAACETGPPRRIRVTAMWRRPMLSWVRVIRTGPGALADDTGTELPGMPGNRGDTNVVTWTIPSGPGRPELVDLCP
ncbi:hypothetical protein MPS_5368 [Mycobacterium pseudoshottsii JCM 15466]|nr:hypothetical protein MPS_5368 [Mycobacterium pseudoshottsii JCM 15466]